LDFCKSSLQKDAIQSWKKCEKRIPFYFNTIKLLFQMNPVISHDLLVFQFHPPIKLTATI
jgi:hypothetical protein